MLKAHSTVPIVRQHPPTSHCSTGGGWAVSCCSSARRLGSSAGGSWSTCTTMSTHRLERATTSNCLRREGRPSALAAAARLLASAGAAHRSTAAVHLQLVLARLLLARRAARSSLALQRLLEGGAAAGRSCEPATAALDAIMAAGQLCGGKAGGAQRPTEALDC